MADDDSERRVLSRKELARELRRAAYQKAKERRATDPRYLAMKEAAREQRRAAYQKLKERRKAEAADRKVQRQAEEKAERAERRTRERAEERAAKPSKRRQSGRLPPSSPTPPGGAERSEPRGPRERPRDHGVEASREVALEGERAAHRDASPGSVAERATERATKHAELWKLVNWGAVGSDAEN